MGTDLRWAAGRILLVFFAVTLVGNLALVLSYIFRRRRGPLALGIGGIAGWLGLMVLPTQILAKWLWFPLVADLAAPYGVGFLLLGCRKLWRKRRPPDFDHRF